MAGANATPNLTPQPPDKTLWAAVFAATLCGVVVSMNIGKLPIALPQLRQEFGLSLMAAGWLLATFNTIAVVAGVFIGIWADRVGALGFCLLGLLVSAVGGLIAIFGQGETSLLVSRAIEGFGFIATGASAPALVSVAAAFGQQRFALGLWSCYLPAGASLSVLLAPPIVAQGGWRSLWWLVLVLLGLAAVILLRQRHSYVAATARRHEGWADVRRALQKPAPWLLMLAFACYSLQFFAVVNWLPTFLAEQRGLSPMTIAVLTALSIAVNVPGNFLGSALLHRHANRGHLIAGVCAIMGLCGLGIYTEVLPDWPRYLLCLMLTGLGGIVPAAVLSSSAVLAPTPQQIGTLQGLFIQGSNLGQFVGPPLIASLVATSGHWHSALGVTLTASVLGIVLGIIVGRLRV